MMHSLQIGTSGWNYEHWRGVFYPRELRPDEWLRFYSRQFHTVEINYSFYKLPERTVFERWSDEAPDAFTFAVKASRYLTHMKKLKDPEEPLHRVISHAEGLGPKLGPILYQLPPHWKVNVDRLRGFLSLLPTHLRHAIEFRDPSWLTDEVFDLLADHSVAYCIMSAPDLPRVMQVTAAFTYIRMHNGGYENDSNYDDHQLQWWARQIMDLLQEVDAYIYFNNDSHGYAVRNAFRLRELART